MSHKIILIASTQYPSYGGSATNAYAMIKSLKKRGHKVIGIFFENLNANVDPDNIGCIFRINYFQLSTPPNTQFDFNAFQKRNYQLINKCQTMINSIYGREPDIMLCKNYKTPIYCRILYPQALNIYLVSGIGHLSTCFPQLTAQQFLSTDLEIPDLYEESTTMEMTDLAVANSTLSLNILYKIFPKYIKKIYPSVVDTTKEIETMLAPGASPSAKTYDFLIVSSILTRPDKNNLFLINVLKNPIFDKYTKLVVGKYSDKFKLIPNTTTYDMMPHFHLMKLMAKCKVLLYPSLVDSNPNTVREAIYHHCLVLISNNVGFYEKFPDFSICLTFGMEEWVRKSLYLVENYEKLVRSYHIDFTMDQDISSFIDNFI